MFRIADVNEKRPARLPGSFSLMPLDAPPSLARARVGAAPGSANREDVGSRPLPFLLASAIQNMTWGRLPSGAERSMRDTQLPRTHRKFSPAEEIKSANEPAGSEVQR